MSTPDSPTYRRRNLKLFANILFKICIHRSYMTKTMNLSYRTCHLSKANLLLGSQHCYFYGSLVTCGRYLTREHRTYLMQENKFEEETIPPQTTLWCSSSTCLVRLRLLKEISRFQLRGRHVTDIEGEIYHHPRKTDSH